MSSILCMPAQDIHFSQLNTTPLFLNSASAGAMGQDYRASLHYKGQWNSIAGSYKTMGVSVDGKILKQGRDKKNSLSAGLTILSDKAGISKINSLEVHGHAAYNLFVTRSQQFSAGFNVGFIQQSISVLNLKWDNQFDGNTYDASRATGENTNFQKTLSLDLGAGILWKLQPKHSPVKLEIGFAIAHIGGTKNSFYRNNYKTPIKYNLNINPSVKLGSAPLIISPQLYYALQAPYKELITGIGIKYLLGQDSREGFLNTYSLSSSSLAVNIYYRIKDALILMLSYEYKKTIGFNVSYDYNISSLNNATQKRGGMEISMLFKNFYRQSGLSKIPVD